MNTRSDNLQELESDTSDKVCPFCKEGDFDLVGLKSHISNGDCEAYNKLPAIDRILQ
jgi:hypothetical protein